MGFFARLKEGLHRTRVNLAGLFSGAVVDEDFFDELETSLIAADIGYEPTRLILQRLKDTVKLNGLKTPEEVRRALRDEIVRILLPAQKPLDVNRAKPFVMMMAGVNGAGKTTFLRILSGDLEPTTGEVIIPKEERMSILKQDHFQYDAYTVLDTVMMGNQRLYDVMKEKDALYERRTSPTRTA